METGLASFVVSSFVFFGMQLRIIMGFCALLQRMGIFGAERENVPRAAPESLELWRYGWFLTRNVMRVILNTD